MEPVRTYKTEREVLTEFLNMFRDAPCLWDVNCRDYSNKRKRAEVMETLVDKMRLLDKDATVASVKKKLENFKASYKREWKKVQKYHHTSKLWYYDVLSFLTENQTFYNSDEGEQLYYDDSNTCDDRHFYDPENSNKRLKLAGNCSFIKNEDRHINKSAEYLDYELSGNENDGDNMFSSTICIPSVEMKLNRSSMANSEVLGPPKEIDEDFTFLMSILPQLRKLDDLQKIKVKTEFMNSLTQAMERKELGHF